MSTTHPGNTLDSCQHGKKTELSYCYSCLYKKLRSGEHVGRLAPEISFNLTGLWLFMVTVFKWYNFLVWSSENEFITSKRGIISYLWRSNVFVSFCKQREKYAWNAELLSFMHGTQKSVSNPKPRKLMLKIDLKLSLNYQNFLQTCNVVLYPLIFLVNSWNEVLKLKNLERPRQARAWVRLPLTCRGEGRKFGQPWRVMRGTQPPISVTLHCISSSVGLLTRADLYT